MTWTLFLPLIDTILRVAPHLIEHVSQIVLRIHPGGHCVTEEDEVLSKHRGRGEKVSSSSTTPVGLQPNADCESHNLLPTVYNVSPAPRLLGSHRSSCKSHGRQSLFPRCLWCSAETYTCSTQLLLTNQKLLKLMMLSLLRIQLSYLVYERTVMKWEQVGWNQFQKVKR